MTAIYRKELRQLFHSVMGYIYLGIFLIIGTVYFLVYNLLPASGDIRNFFSPLMSTVIFLLPMLTMRAYSEERKMRTASLLLSAPVSAGEIAVGKFLAILTVFAAGLVFTLLYVLVLFLYGQFDFLMVMGNYAGLLISASAFIAIGLWVSALTENQITACLCTYAILFGLWIAGIVQKFMSSNFLRDLLGAISISSRFAEFSMGIFSLDTVVYYLSVTVFFLFLVTRETEKWRAA